MESIWLKHSLQGVPAEVGLGPRNLAAYLQQGVGLQKGERLVGMLANPRQYPVAQCGEGV